MGPLFEFIWDAEICLSDLRPNIANDITPSHSPGTCLGTVPWSWSESKTQNKYWGSIRAWVMWTSVYTALGNCSIKTFVWQITFIFIQDYLHKMNQYGNLGQFQTILSETIVDINSFQNTRQQVLNEAVYGTGDMIMNILGLSQSLRPVISESSDTWTLNCIIPTLL